MSLLYTYKSIICQERIVLASCQSDIKQWICEQIEWLTGNIGPLPTRTGVKDFIVPSTDLHCISYSIPLEWTKI